MHRAKRCMKREERVWDERSGPGTVEDPPHFVERDAGCSEVQEAVMGIGEFTPG